jgi:murein DD-endopeptidase MepM/ murein hydrolase activator NlpD
MHPGSPLGARNHKNTERPEDRVCSPGSRRLRGCIRQGPTLQIMGCASAKCLGLLICLAMTLCPGAPPARAAGPDYSVPGRWTWPWACGAGYRISWGPADHWAFGKATGLAYDLAMPEGTPVYAPTGGMAYFLHDERPLETNYGYYVELVDGDWLIRLAHLRDPASGERMVRAGELLGYAGRSGVSAAHLHLEILVWNGARWVAPDVHRLQRLFGLPLANLETGAILTNEGCAAQVSLAAPVQPLQPNPRLGEATDLLVSLRNDGLDALLVETVQLTLYAPTGASLVAETRGAWTLLGKKTLSVGVRAYPSVSGTWRVGRVTVQAQGVVYGLAVTGSWFVAPSALKLVDLLAPSELDAGGAIALEVTLENSAAVGLAFDDLVVKGLDPKQVPWTASLGSAGVIPGGATRLFILQSNSVPWRVGLWTITEIGYRQGAQTFSFASVDRSFAVHGPELIAEQLVLYAMPDRVNVFMRIINVGDQPVTPEAIELWVGDAEGEDARSLRQTQVGPLLPGQAAFIQLNAPLTWVRERWRLLGAGYWREGMFYWLELPAQPVVIAE